MTLYLSPTPICSDGEGGWLKAYLQIENTNSDAECPFHNHHNLACAQTEMVF